MSQPDGPEPSAVPLEARILDVVQQAVIATDTAGDVIFWNKFAEEMYGWTAAEAIGRPVVEVTPSDTSREEAVEILERLTRGASWSGEFAVQRKDGTRFTAFVVDSPILDDDGTLVGVVGISTDVSARRALEHQMQQVAKMEAIGRLAGGVAHDFNNLLTVILGHADMALHDPGTDDGSRASMEAVHAAATRAAELTQQLLAFSRQQLVSPRVVDLTRALDRLAPMLRRLIEADIAITLEVPWRPLCAVIDPTQLDQIVMNLALNARDAMPDGGELRLTLDPVVDTEPGAPVDPQGKALRLRVADTGVGMPPEVLSNIFEPFFTTKRSEVGTGIGLAIVYGIVRQADGVVRVDSSPGAGTTFEVLLPRVPAPGVQSETPEPSSEHAVGGGTILLVEDDPAVRSLAARILRAAGYVVLEAASADEAAAIGDAHDGTIDLLVSDVVMPGGSGFALGDQLRASRPGAKVLLMTGYAGEEALRRARSTHDVRLVQKPFVAADLLSAVRAVLTNP